MPRRLLPVFAVLALLAACTSPNPLGIASYANAVDTVTLYALTGTPVYRPSAYSMSDRHVARLDVTGGIDFGFDLLPSGDAVLQPSVVLGLNRALASPPGLLRSTTAFDSITTAVTSGYTTAENLSIAAGNTFYARGRVPSTCYLGLPIYGKVSIVAIDRDARTVKLQVLTNNNCGFKSLTTGLPKN